MGTSISNNSIMENNHFPCPLNAFTEKGKIPTRACSYLFRPRSRQTAKGGQGRRLNSLITTFSATSIFYLAPLPSILFLLKTNICSFVFHTNAFDEKKKNPRLVPFLPDVLHLGKSEKFLLQKVFHTSTNSPLYKEGRKKNQ